MWVKLQSDLFQFDEDVYICNVYIPPSASKVLKSQDVDMFDILEQGVEQGVVNYKNHGKIYITGDFNSRTSKEPDFLDFDKYLDDDIFIQDSRSTTTFTTRVNKDHVVDCYGRRLLLFCQVTDLCIANGRLGGDRNVGRFTFVSHNGLSVVDYLLCSHNDSKFVENFYVVDFNEFSDHSPTVYSLALKLHVEEHNNPTDINNDSHPRHKIVYDETKLPFFRQQLLDCQGVLDQLISDVNVGQVDGIVQSFTNFMYDSTQAVFTKSYGKSYRPSHKFAKNRWFNDNCKEARENFKRARNIFTKNKNALNRINFIKARNNFTKVKRSAKRKLRLQQGKDVCDMAKKQPKTFWKTVQKTIKPKQSESSKLTAADLYEHFKFIYGDERDLPTEPNFADENIENHEMDCDISEQELRKAVFSRKKIIKALALMNFVPNYSKAHSILSPSSYLSCTIDCFPMANTPDFGEKA